MTFTNAMISPPEHGEFAAAEMKTPPTSKVKQSAVAPVVRRPATSSDYWWAVSPYERRWVMMVVAPSVIRTRQLLVRYAIAIHGWPLWFEPDWKRWNRWCEVRTPNGHS